MAKANQKFLSTEKHSLLKCFYFTRLGITLVKTSNDGCRYKYRYCVIVNDVTVHAFSLKLFLLLRWILMCSI